MKAGLPPGPNNIPMATTEFKKATDAMEIDVAVKSGVKGEFYAEVIDPISGEKIIDTPKQQITQAGGWGTGFGLPNVAGDFELDVYFNGELVYTTPVTIR